MGRTPKSRSQTPRVARRRRPRLGASKAEGEEFFGGSRLVFPYDPHAGVPNDAHGIWFLLSGPTTRVYDLIARNVRLRSWLYDLRSDHRRPGQVMDSGDGDLIETFATLIGGHIEMQRELARMSEEQLSALDLGGVDRAYAQEIATTVAGLDLDAVDWEQLAGILAPLADAARPYGEYGTVADLAGNGVREEPGPSEEASSGD